MTPSREGDDLWTAFRNLWNDGYSIRWCRFEPCFPTKWSEYRYRKAACWGFWRKKLSKFIQFLNARKNAKQQISNLWISGRGEESVGDEIDPLPKSSFGRVHPIWVSETNCQSDTISSSWEWWFESKWPSFLHHEHLQDSLFLFCMKPTWDAKCYIQISTRIKIIITDLPARFLYSLLEKWLRLHYWIGLGKV